MQRAESKINDNDDNTICNQSTRNGQQKDSSKKIIAENTHKQICMQVIDDRLIITYCTFIMLLMIIKLFLNYNI